MFYITQFFKAIASTGYRGAIFIGLTLLYFALSFSSKGIRHQLFGENLKEQSDTSFFVLTDANLSADTIMRKLYKLASIENVHFFTEEQLSQRVGRISQDLGVEGKFIVEQYMGFKVSLRSGINPSKVELIQQYIKRMDPSAEYIFSSLVKPLAVTTQSYLAKYSSIVALLGITLSWFLVAILVLKPIKKRAYIVERFQRKKWVALKILGSGMFLFLALNILGFIFIVEHFTPALYTSSAAFILLTLATVKKNRWQV